MNRKFEGLHADMEGVTFKVKNQWKREWPRNGSSIHSFRGRPGIM